MAGIPKYIHQIKQKYRIANDYALAKKLKVSQPEANWFRRGKKVPNTSVCIRMANLLEKSPVEILILAQKDRAAPEEKSHWDMALTAVDVMVNVPKHPRYIPKKVEAIGQELRQLESQMLTYEGTLAYNEALALIGTVELSVDSIMERWQIWKRDGSLFPNYLMANQSAVRRGVKIRRVFILRQSQMRDETQLTDFVQVLNDQRRAGISVFFAFGEELEQTLIFQRLVEEYQKHDVRSEINAALFDGEVLIFSRSYADRHLGVNGVPIPISMIEQLDITWNRDHLRDLNPSPLFETRCVTEYRGERSFKKHVDRFRNKAMPKKV